VRRNEVKREKCALTHPYLPELNSRGGPISLFPNTLSSRLPPLVMKSDPLLKKGESEKRLQFATVRLRFDI
jgi:hypothetical protein